MKPKIITHAVGHVLTLEECRKQCEVVPFELNSDGDTHPDDSLLLQFLDAAVGMAEDFTGLSIAVRTYEIAMSEFPKTSGCPRRSAPIVLPMPPLIEVISFQTEDGSDGPMDLDSYRINDYAVPAEIVPTSSWPSGTYSLNDIKVRFRAGYSDDDSDAQPLPPQIRQALLLTVADWYKNREDSVEGDIRPLPNGAIALLRPLRVRLGMA